MSGGNWNKCGDAFYVDEAEAAGERRWRSVVVLRGEDETPLAERGDVDVVRICFQAGLLQRVRDAPERIAREHWRCALHDDDSLGAEVAGDGAVESGGVELAEGIIRRVGEIDDDEIETVGVGVDPGKGVGVDDVKLRRRERALIQLREHRVAGENLRHLGIEVDERDAFDLGIFEDFADGEAVATA